MHFPHLAQRLFNVPLAILPEKAEVILAALSERLGITQIVRANGELLSLEGAGAIAGEEWTSSRGDVPRGYEVLNGVAIIPIEGTLVQKLGTLRPYSGMTGYDGIRQNFFTALADSAVEKILFDVNSPGGECSGLFDLVDAIYAARGEKPIWAALDENACSAAYALASAADRITVPRTGSTGSIGVIQMHVDWSEALKKDGIKVTYLYYGARKADGNEAEPLGDEARARFQSEIDEIGDLFVETVARNRNLAAKKVRDTEAATFLGAKGIELGLADAVMAPDAAYRAFLG